MTEAQFRWLLAFVGGDLTQEDAAARLVRLGTLKAVTLEVLRERRAALIMSPASVTITGALSVNQAENIRAIDRLILEVANGPDDPSAPGEDASVADNEWSTSRLSSRWARRGRARVSLRGIE